MNELDVDVTTLKQEFAFHLLMNRGNKLAAATAIAPDDMQFRLHVAKYWPGDLYVIAHKKHLVEEHGPAYFLPNKYELAEKVLDVAENALHPEEKLKGYKQYAELLGMIEKPSPVSIDNRQVTVNKVMVVRDHGSDAEWEAKAEKQQRALTLEHVPN